MQLVTRIRSLAADDTLDLTGVRASLDRLIRMAVGFDVGAISTVDPATLLWTSCYVSGIEAEGAHERERVLFDNEFRGGDLNGYVELANADRPAGRLLDATGGDLTVSRRYRVLLAGFGIVDELRVVLRTGEQCWGTLTLYRTGSNPPFDAHDEAVLVAAAPAMAELFRLAFLRAALALTPSVEQPPGLVLVSPTGEVQVTSDAARAWLEAIDDRGRIPSALRSVAAAAASGDGLARAAVPTPSGRWVVLHGSPLGSTDGGESQVAVIIEGARPAVVSEVIAQAYGFTPRERDITGLAAQGRTTKQMAIALGISPFTVQDHLKAIFAKTGVQSRGELVATLYVQQYEPRTAAGVTPGPYGWYLDAEAATA